MSKVIIITGGTMVHVRPHFSLCAPAYGKIGTSFNTEFYLQNPDLDVHLEKTKMAGGSRIETNEDLSQYVDEILEDEDVSCIIFSAAVCDYEPFSMASGPRDEHDGIIYDKSCDFGKEYPRLSSKHDCELELTASDKIIDKIKKKRPDIFLVTFKTTSGEYTHAVMDKSMANARRCGSDVCFGNDIKNKINTLYYNIKDKEMLFSSTRESCIKMLVKYINKHIT